MPQPLLMTKLFIPRLPAHSVRRYALESKWLEGFLSGRRATLVCAPAGYGKTTLMLDLLKASAAVPAWLSLDEGDNDAHRFLLYLCAAFRQAGVILPDGLEALFQDAGFQAPEPLMTMLISGASAFDQKLLLVLDDYHVIRHPKVHGLVQFLLSHQPPNLHLAVLTREDPPLNLSRLRLAEELMELRGGDLLFDPGETARLLESALGQTILRDSAARIADCTEGWAAGIKLYALALAGQTPEEAKAYIEKISGTHAYIIDYLVEEVLNALPEDLRSFLLKTSVLLRLDGSLCDAVTGCRDGREMLREISRRNLFLIPLDDKREWFRYHALFAGSVRAGLSREEEGPLYTSAAFHMKSRGFDSEAVAYGFASGNCLVALKLVEDSTEEAFRAAQLDMLLQWLSRLPDDMVQNSEILCMRRPIACFITGRFQEAVAYINALGPDFENTATPHNRGLLYCLRAMIAGASGQDAEPPAREALRCLEPFDPIARISALNTLGRAQYCKGNVQEAANTFQSALASSLPMGHQFVTTLVMMNYSSCLGVMGRPREALEQCEAYMQGMAQKYGQLPPYAGILYVTMAGFLHALGDEKRAEKLRAEGSLMCASISYDIAASLKVYENRPVKEHPAAPRPLEFGEKLSGREMDILRLLCQGMSNGEIAKALFISTNTAQWHISHLYSKLGVKSRTQAIAKAREMGLAH